MFLDFTLTKNGSFVYCEDASDYDENLPVQQNPEEVQAVQQELSNAALGYGMVKKVQVKTLPIYQKLNEILRNVSEEPTDLQDTVSQVNELKSFAGQMFDDLRMVIGKAYGVRASVDHAWSMLPVINSMKVLVNNQHLIVRSKYNSLTMQFQYNGLAKTYDITGYINSLIINDNQEFTFGSESRFNNRIETFNSWEELLQAFYSSDIPEDDNRFTVPKTQSADFADITSEVYNIQNNCDPYDRVEDVGFARREIFTKLMNFNSIIERRVMINLHNLYMECMVNSAPSGYRDLMHIATELRNVFIVNLMYAIGCGYETEVYRYARANYAEYVALCLSVIDEAKLG